MDQVVFEYCNSYDFKNVKNAVYRLIGRLNGNDDKIVRKNEKILIKINNIGPYPPEAAATTHPSIVEAVIDFILENGGMPIVCDGPIAAPQKLPFRFSGIEEVCNRRKVALLNFNSAETRYIDAIISGGTKIDSILIPQAVLDADGIINIPKFKTHDLTVFTGAIKNLFGFTPFHIRMPLHRKFHKESEFSALLIDIYSVFQKKIRLNIMDAVDVMEGDGPVSGTSKHIGLILASYEAALLDAACVWIAGGKPSAHSTTRIALDRYDRHISPDNVEVFVRNFENLPRTSFVLPQNTMKIYGKLFQYLPKNTLYFRPRVNSQACMLCNTCINNCPVKALSILNKKVVLQFQECFACFCCREACEAGAVEIQGYLMGSANIFNTAKYFKKLLCKLK
jgi:uncharacterized protein (DUF362 family)/NAD-dependent dihydropyrimidine dehydrogenase PreA subunit